MNAFETKLKERLSYLDGLRTLFCFIVIVDHFLYFFFPEVKVILYNDGNLSVIYFLILSGYLVVYANLKKDNYIMKLSEIPVYVLKRYTRLLPVVFITVCISGIAYFSGRIYSLKAAETFQLMESSLATMYMPPEVFSVGRLFYEGFIGSFVGVCNFNRPFWTIKYELWGVVALWITCNLIKSKKIRGGVYVVLCLLAWFLYDFYLGCVFAGGFLADVLYNKNENIKPLESLYYWIRSRKSSIPLMIVAVLSYVFFEFTYVIYGKAIVIGVLMLELYKSNKMKKIFENRLLVSIGERAYEIYAVHIIVLCSFSCWLMIQLEKMNMVISWIFVCMVSIGLSVILGWLLNQFIKLSKTWLRRIVIASKNNGL